MLDLSIIIVNWNGKDLLTKCLQCVESTVKKISYETYVVDNASTDGSQDIVRLDFPNVKLIANTDNVGFATANNQAMKVATGRYILLLNSDAFVKENTLDTMVKFMDEHPDAGMASCKLLYENGTVQPSVMGFPTLETEFYTVFGLEKMFPNSKRFGKYLMRYWDHNDLREVKVILGAFMMVRHSAIDQVGMMDPGFFMYSEETDWCYRFINAGWKIYSTPETEAIHIWGGTSQQVKVPMQLQMYRSRIQFFRKHYGRLQTWTLKSLLIIGCLLRVIPGTIYYRTRRDKNLSTQQTMYRQLLGKVLSY